MTSRYPETGVRAEDVITNGDDVPAVRRAPLFAAALVLVAFGIGLGTRLDGRWLWREPAPPLVPLFAGTMDSVADPGAVPDRHRFRLALFNDGERTVEVRVRALMPSPVRLTHRSVVAVAPHSWGYPRFTAPGECDHAEFPLASSVSVRMRVGDVTTTQPVPLGGGSALHTLHRLECPAVAALGHRQLTGAWLLEQVDGRWKSLEGRQLIRFRRDGRFVAAPGGRLFVGQYPGVNGAFTLDGSRLRLRVASGLACAPGTRVDWSTTALGDGLLRLAALHDVGCVAGRGERWILRRLPGGDGAPSHGPSQRPSDPGPAGGRP